MLGRERDRFAQLIAGREGGEQLEVALAGDVEAADEARDDAGAVAGFEAQGRDALEIGPALMPLSAGLIFSKRPDGQLQISVVDADRTLPSALHGRGVLGRFVFAQEDVVG